MSDHGLSEFVSALASEAPTPGGGGAAALCGALAAALCAMASRLTAGRKKYADRAETLCAIIGQSDARGRGGLQAPRRRLLPAEGRSAERREIARSHAHGLQSAACNAAVRLRGGGAA